LLNSPRTYTHHKSYLVMGNTMISIHFSLPVDEDTNMVIRMVVEKIRKSSENSVGVDVTMEQLIDFKELLEEIIAENDRSDWL
jgi:hypothetical protein